MRYTERLHKFYTSMVDRWRIECSRILIRYLAYPSLLTSISCSLSHFSSVHADTWSITVTKAMTSPKQSDLRPPGGRSILHYNVINELELCTCCSFTSKSSSSSAAVLYLSMCFVSCCCLSQAMDSCCVMSDTCFSIKFFSSSNCNNHSRKQFNANSLYD